MNRNAQSSQAENSSRAAPATKLAFFGIGPQRTASTWLYTALSTHPGIAFPHQVKETMFFDRHFDRGLDWYLWHFRNAGPDQICGEVGPTYFDDDGACERIKECFPEAEIFINVRNPIARSHSLFRHHLSKGRVPNSFQTAIDKLPRIVDSGRYREHCLKWEEAFGDRITYLVQEDIQEDPDSEEAKKARDQIRSNVMAMRGAYKTERQAALNQWIAAQGFPAQEVEAIRREIEEVYARTDPSNVLPNTHFISENVVISVDSISGPNGGQSITLELDGSSSLSPPTLEVSE